MMLVLLPWRTAFKQKWVGKAKGIPSRTSYHLYLKPKVFRPCQTKSMMSISDSPCSSDSGCHFLGLRCSRHPRQCPSFATIAPGSSTCLRTQWVLELLMDGLRGSVKIFCSHGTANLVLLDNADRMDSAKVNI